MKFSRRKILVILFVVFVALAAAFYWRSNNNQSRVSRIVNETPQQNEQATPGEEASEENPKQTQGDESPIKNPPPPASATVTEPPLVYTGYGHAQDDPLKLNQETSTTCTTAAGASCSISFKSSDGRSAQLEAKTVDSQGVAIWNWRGSEVGAGTWSVTAIAGDKISNIETIYIQ